MKDLIRKILVYFYPRLKEPGNSAILTGIGDLYRGFKFFIRLTLAKNFPSSPNITLKKKRVVFVSDFPLRREFKFALGLMSVGWEVILLHRKNFKSMGNSQFTDVIQFNSSYEAVQIAKNTKANIFHCFSPSWDNTILQFLKHKPGKVLSDIYDIQFLHSHGTPSLYKLVSGDISRQLEIINSSDGIVSPDLQIQYWKNNAGIKLACPSIFFPNYCWGTKVQNKKQTNECKIVQVGGMCFETEDQHDVGSFKVVKKLVESGCYFDLFMHPTDSHKKGTPEYERRYSDYISLAEATGRVKIWPSISASEIVYKLSEYDFGLNMINAANFSDTPWKVHNPQGLAYILSARNFDYIDAGLNILIDGNHNFNLRFFKDSGKIHNCSKILFKKDLFQKLTDFKKNSKRNELNQIFGIKNNIYRLEKFYEVFTD